MATDSRIDLWRQADAILDQLLDLPDEQQRRKLQQMTCPEALRDCVEQLLDAAQVQGILDKGELNELQIPPEDPLPNLSGREFGSYRLQELIGEGGMSSVYRAVRTDGAYDAPVAFKLLQTALLSTDWYQHFQREARFLANLRHPNIASLLDAGISEDGTPWLVTEYVDGLPIDQYCRIGNLDMRKRVELILQLCRAVAFAQKNLIVHRDIKPANVLVTEDGRVVLLDFGIARAMDRDAPDSIQTRMTRAFTPKYAAPEQLAGQPVTTATDVFALGAVLYKVLTDSSPFKAGDQTTRTTEEPSRRLNDCKELAAAERRSRKQILRGDLDNIVLKALTEEPERRYTNAEAMADDLDAWLAHRPVSARKPSTGYRLKLFVRRRTALASSLAALVLVATIGMTAAAWLAREARVQAADAMASEARATAIAEFMLSLFEASDPDLTGIDNPSASDLLAAGVQRAEEAFIDQPALRTELLLSLARIHRKLGDREAAQSLIASSGAVEHGLPLQQAQAWLTLSNLHFDAATAMDQAIEAAEQGIALLPDNAPTLLQVDLGLALAEALSRSGRNRQAIEMTESALERLEGSGPDTSETTTAYLAVLVALSGFQNVVDDYETSADVAERAWALIRNGVGTPTLTLNALSNYSLALQRLGRLNEALELQLQALEIVERTYPEAHRMRATMHSNLSSRLLDLGQFAEAEQHMREAMAIYSEIYPEPNLYSAPIYNNLGNLMVYLDRHVEARQYLEVAASIAESAFGADDRRTLITRHNLASALSRGGMEREGEQALLDILEHRSRVLQSGSTHIALTKGSLAKHYLIHGPPEQALQWSEAALQTLAFGDHSRSMHAIIMHSYRARALQQLGQTDAARETFDLALMIADELGSDAGSNYLRAVDSYLAYLLEFDPPAALALIERMRLDPRFDPDLQRPEVSRILAVEAALRGH